MIKPKGIIFILRNWKLIVHLLLGTSRFGVNNQWKSNFDSLFTRRGHLTPRVVLNNYRGAKYRATACCFLSGETCRNLGWNRD